MSFFFLYFQALRGDTCNLIYVDESAYVATSAYSEILPMLQTDGGHMILTSSHKRGQDSREFVNIDRLRSNETLINNVIHVCRSHVRDIVSGTVTSVFCPCFVFQQPLHMKTNHSYMKITSLFAQSTRLEDQDNEDEGDKWSAMKVSMMSELGVLPPQSRMDLLDVEAPTVLSTPEAATAFCSKLIPVEEYVSDNPVRSDLIFSKSITVYIDPTPTDVGSSLHALSFVTKATPTDPTMNTLYVLLAVEEFETNDLERLSNDGLKALGTVLMQTCLILHELYGGYFTTIYVVPEANSICVIPLWKFCGDYYNMSGGLKEKGIEMYTTTMVKRKQRALPDYKVKVKKPKLDKDALQTRDQVALDSLRIICAQNEERNVNRNTLEYRVGYALGKKKVQYMYHFFSSIYNPDKKRKAEFVAATHLWAFWVRRRNPLITSVFRFVTDKLGLLQIKHSVNSVTGQRTYSVGGKATSKGQYVQDDAAIALVMSTVLCEEFTNNTFAGRLLRLE